MTTRGQITKRAQDEGVTAQVVERDYVLAHAVAAIATADREGVLAFKGGTSLRLVHFDDYRYSADLDYSITAGSAVDAATLIGAALAATSTTNVAMRVVAEIPPRIAYVGPLGKERTIKLDLTDDELVVNTQLRALVRRWNDLPTVPVRVYSQLEIASEKLRCVLQRFQCRDLLDLDALLESEVEPRAAQQLFERKALHRGFDPTTFAARFEQRMISYQQRWTTELGDYLAEVPDFDDLARRVRRKLRLAGLLARR